jgi:Uma2 family endonuclease
MTLTPVKWTLEEYRRLGESGILGDRRVELLRGEIVEMAMEGEPHAYSTHEAAEYLMDRLGSQVSVRQSHPVTLPNNSEPEPDLAIVERLGREYRIHHPYPENVYWLIEYAQSSLEKDLEIKSKLYAEVNIPEYWVIDLNAMRLIVFRDPQEGNYRTQQVYTSGIIYPISFPDVAIAVKSLLNP